MSSLLEQASLIITPNGVKAGKLYGLKGTDLDVVRATTATRVNSAGLIETVANNVARLDYTNGSCPSILVEPQRTNLTLQSQSATTSVVNIGYTATDNNTNSPSGVLNASRILEDTGTLHLIQKTFSVGSTTESYSVSYFIKSISRPKGKIVYGLDGAPFNSIDADFDLSNETITTATASGAGAVAGTSNIKDFGNGWYRVSISGVIGVSGTHYVRIFGLNDSGNSSYIGDPTKGFFIWGFQAEAGSYPTSYIPTVASAVTRNADVISKTGIADLIGQSEGVLFVDIKAQFNSADEQDLSISDGTGNNRALIRITSNGVIRSIGVFGGNVEFNLGGTPYVTGTRYKIALAYKNNDVALYINGTLQGSASTTSISGTLSRLGFDIFTNNAQIIVSPVNAVILFKTRLTNAQLATLTTL